MPVGGLIFPLSIPGGSSIAYVWGFVRSPNPSNRKQISHVSLNPKEVEVVVFWTRNPQPLVHYLRELEQRGFLYYFQFTVMDNPRQIDTKTPPLSSSLRAFQRLSGIIGPEKVIWRYDPIVISNITDMEFHINKYKSISKALQGYTLRSVISIVDIYSKLKKRLKILKEKGVEIMDCNRMFGRDFDGFMSSLAQIANENKMEIVSCAEEPDLKKYNILPGKCIDDNYIERVFGINVAHKKDPCQRKACGCVVSKDIGMYNTCLFGCQYCYATTNFEKANTLYKSHNPNATSLID